MHSYTGVIFLVSGSTDYHTYPKFWKFQFSQQRPNRKMVDYRTFFEDQRINYMSEEVHDWIILPKIWHFPLQTKALPSWPCFGRHKNVCNTFCIEIFPVLALQSPYKAILHRNIQATQYQNRLIYEKNIFSLYPIFTEFRLPTVTCQRYMYTQYGCFW